MKFCTKILILISLSMTPNIMEAIDNDSIRIDDLNEVVIVKKKPGNMRLSGPQMGFEMNQGEMFRAACCNLGESFSTNPSVDVNYADPATGTKQIKLLGLSGSYVQLMTENLPAFRGAALPFAFRYVPGTWMKSIRVSKGASTVKNGYEPITGQIDIEYLKPQDEHEWHFNGYFDTDTRYELNADANFHVSKRLNTIVLAHFENKILNHDGNHDGFVDVPKVKNINLMNRWNLFTQNYIMHAGISYLLDKSRAGQIGNHAHFVSPFLITLDTHRGEAYMKHAFIIDHNHNSNIALAANASFHQLDSFYGWKKYDVNEKSLYAQLMYETDFTSSHNLSCGLSLNHDYLTQNLFFATSRTIKAREKETVGGTYAQYTFKPSSQFTLMAGYRVDKSSTFGFFSTPRFNVKYSPIENLVLKCSIGKGYRTCHPWAEYNYLLASGREMVVENLQQEKAWNYGVSSDFTMHIKRETLKLSAEYFYTRFKQQAVVDYESNLSQIIISNLVGKSYSNVVQLQADYESSFGISATLAWRYNDVKTSYHGILMEKALTSKYKLLSTISYKTPLELWQFDATFVYNGGGRMPAPYTTSTGELSWPKRFRSFPSLNLQATRFFRHFSIYLGGENLTNFKQRNPIIDASNPWSSTFDPTVVWGPVMGAMAYVGIRFNFK